MKDGRTHLAHKAEQAVDLETGAIVGVTVQDADAGDTTTMVETLLMAADQLAVVAETGLAEIVRDKGYHSNQTLTEFVEIGLCSYISEPGPRPAELEGKGRRSPRRVCQSSADSGRPAGSGSCGSAANGSNVRTRISTRPGGCARVHLREHPNILKRLLVHVCGFNLGLLMRQLTGVATPRSLHGRAAALVGALCALIAGTRRLWRPVPRPETPNRSNASWIDLATRCHEHRPFDLQRGASTTGC